MWIWQDPGLSDADLGRHRTQFIVTIVDWLWSRPAGVVAALLGALVLVGSQMKKSVEQPPAAS